MKTRKPIPLILLVIFGLSFVSLAPSLPKAAATGGGPSVLQVCGGSGTSPATINSGCNRLTAGSVVVTTIETSSTNVATNCAGISILPPAFTSPSGITWTKIVSANQSGIGSGFCVESATYISSIITSGQTGVSIGYIANSTGSVAKIAGIIYEVAGARNNGYVTSSNSFAQGSGCSLNTLSLTSTTFQPHSVLIASWAFDQNIGNNFTAGGGFFSSEAMGVGLFWSEYSLTVTSPSSFPARVIPTADVCTWAGTGVALAPAFYQIVVETDPANLAYGVIVDGTQYSATQTFYWIQGSSHNITAASAVNVDDGTYQWDHWSNFGSQSQIVTPSANGTYTAFFDFSPNTTGACNFFQLQCWWFPLLMFAVSLGPFAIIGGVGKVGTRGMIYLVLVSLTFSALVQVLMGLLNIMFPIILTLSTIVYAVRFGR